MPLGAESGKAKAGRDIAYGPTHLEAIIVGGGVSGIASAVRFQLDLQLSRYLIFEQSDDLGESAFHDQSTWFSQARSREPAVALAGAARWRLSSALATCSHAHLPYFQHVGGTWHLNTYPGAGCDIPTRLYSFSFAQRDNWDIFFSLQPEIKSCKSRCSQGLRQRSEGTDRMLFASLQCRPQGCDESI